jgi:hypothetical protein
MKIHALSIGGLLMLSTLGSCVAGNAVDAAQFIAKRGGKLFDAQPRAKSPDQSLTPVIYYDKGNSVPSCGLINAKPGGEVDLIELVGSEQGVGYPLCMGINSITRFDFLNRNYVSVEYTSRETREDEYRYFQYLYKDPKLGFVVDEPLSSAVYPAEVNNEKAMPDRTRVIEGIKLAQAAFVKIPHREWRLSRRDFIFDDKAWFAIFEDKKRQECHFAAQMNASPVISDHLEYAPEAKCLAVLAASRLAKADTTYYLAMFKTTGPKPSVAIMSMASNGKISAEKTLAQQVNRSGATTDIRAAKAELSKMLSR